jgi:hypothetical protein
VEKTTELRMESPIVGFNQFYQTWRDLYSDLMGEGKNRKEKYAQYLYLDKNLAEAAACLNVYSDNIVSGTVGGDENYYVSIDEDESEIEELEELVNGVEKETQVKDLIWDISRNLIRDGDEFEEVVLGDKGEGLEIVRLKRLPPDEVEARVDERGRFLDPKVPYQQRIPGLAKPIDLDWWRVIHFKVGNDVYGVDKSIFSNASLRIGRQLIWVDEALVLARMSRAWLRFAYLIDTGKLGPDEALTYVQKFMDRLKDRKVVASSTTATGRTSVIDAPLLPDEDIGIPVGEGSKADVRPLVGDTNLSNIGDVYYLQNKFLMACTMPKAYVSLEEGVNARATIGQLDVQFARQVRRRQQSLKPGLRQFYSLAFTLAGKDPDSFDWDIEFPELATTDETLKWNVMSIKAAIAKVLAVDIGVVNNDYILRELLGFDEDMVKKYAAKMTPAQAAPQPPGPGAPLPSPPTELLRANPELRLMLEDLKDIVSYKLDREERLRHRKLVGLDSPICVKRHAID